jgi:predicted NAD/FAD-dependent oxidoreductase
LSLRFGIVGAGMAGLACAEALRTRDPRPVLLDKGRSAGGRMAAR